MTLNPICKEYTKYGEYGIMNKWIEQTHRLCGKNKKKTIEKLDDDVENRKQIQKLHSERSASHHTSDKFHKKGEQIDKLVRKRNVKLEDLKKIALNGHYFDFHWMTTNGAKKYVDDIKSEIESFTGGVTVNIITGKGLHSTNGRRDEPVSLLQQALLDQFPHCIEKSASEGGVLILSIRKKPTVGESMRER